MMVETGPLLNIPVLSLRFGYVFPNKYDHLQVVTHTHKPASLFVQVRIYLRN